MDLQQISNKYVAGFLQKAIIKQVQKEDEILHAFDPRPELPHFIAKKDKKNLLGWIIFSKNLVRYNCSQLLP